MRVLIADASLAAHIRTEEVPILVVLGAVAGKRGNGRTTMAQPPRPAEACCSSVRS